METERGEIRITSRQYLIYLMLWILGRMVWNVEAQTAQTRRADGNQQRSDTLTSCVQISETRFDQICAGQTILHVLSLLRSRRIFRGWGSRNSRNQLLREHDEW